MPAPKRQVNDLAIFGGTPAFDHVLHVGRPNLPDRHRLQELIDGALDRRWLSNDGPLVRQFEASIAELLGVRNCVATCNATVALGLALRALGVTGEVAVPAFTFVATAHSVAWHGATPVFCDVGRESHNLDPELLGDLIGPSTAALMPVHLWGRGCDVDRIGEVAAGRGLPVIYDAAHALGCSVGGSMIGGFGAVEVFSFHATKFLNTFEGGALTTNDDSLAAELRLVRDFGFGDGDSVVHLGTNGKMNEISAAMGIASLERMPHFIEVNRCNYEHYRRMLGEIGGLKVVDYTPSESNNYQYIVVEVDADGAGLERDTLLRILWEENIRVRRYFYPGCHRSEPYCSDPRYQGLSLPSVEALARCVAVLPNGTAIAAGDVEAICHLLSFVVTNSRSIRRRLAVAGAYSAGPRTESAGLGRR